MIKKNLPGRHQNNVVYTKNRASKYMKQNLIKLKGIEKCIILGGDFNIRSQQFIELLDRKSTRI